MRYLCYMFGHPDGECVTLQIRTELLAYCIDLITTLKILLYDLIIVQLNLVYLNSCYEGHCIVDEAYAFCKLLCVNDR